MEIGSVGSAAATLQQQLAATQSTQQGYADQAAEQARIRQETTRMEATRQNEEASRTEAIRARERTQEAQQAEQQKVFVNAQGQKTGTIISTTA